MTEIDARQVAHLVRTQIPQWANLPVMPVENGGWDNRTFRLDDGVLVSQIAARTRLCRVEKGTVGYRC
jgi:aminoglycoside phosphotransferase (APT) family kinase protein